MTVVYRPDPALNTPAKIAPGGGNQPDTSMLPANDPISMFGSTQRFKDYYGSRSIYLNTLRRAKIGADGSIMIPPGTMPNFTGQMLSISDARLGGDFNQLGKDYTSWLSQQKASETDWENYAALQKSMPGRGATMFAANQQPSTMFGSNQGQATTVFG